MSEAPIESRQFIGWWCDAVSDAITSLAYTGERAIHSSDFSAFTKRSHCPSLLRFSGPKIMYFGRDSSICTSATAYSGTLFSLRWSAMDYRRCQPPCARFIARDHPHSKCVKCLGFSHARDAVYGIWNLILWESLSHNPPLSAWGVWKGVIHFSPSRSGGLRGFAWIRGLSWFRDLRFGCWARGDGEWADRPRLSLPPSPEHVRANSPVEFAHYYLYPSPGARDHFPSG